MLTLCSSVRSSGLTYLSNLVYLTTLFELHRLLRVKCDDNGYLIKLFNDASNSFDYIELSELERSGFRIILLIVMECVWRNWVKPRKHQWGKIISWPRFQPGILRLWCKCEVPCLTARLADKLSLKLSLIIASQGFSIPSINQVISIIPLNILSTYYHGDIRLRKFWTQDCKGNLNFINLNSLLWYVKRRY